MADLKDAIGGFVLYRAVMRLRELERILYLEVRDTIEDGCQGHRIFNTLFQEPIGTLLIEAENLYIIVFDSDNQRIVQWIP